MSFSWTRSLTAAHMHVNTIQSNPHVCGLPRGLSMYHAEICEQKHMCKWSVNAPVIENLYMHVLSHVLVYMLNNWSHMGQHPLDGFIMVYSRTPANCTNVRGAHVHQCVSPCGQKHASKYASTCNYIFVKTCQNNSDCRSVALLANMSGICHCQCQVLIHSSARTVFVPILQVQ